MEKVPTKDQAALEQQLDEIERFITHNTPEEALASLNETQKLKFLSDYYLTETLNYEEEINKKTEENVLVLEKELESSSKAPYSPALIEALLNICKMSIIDQMVDSVSKTHQTLRDKLKGLKINEFKATMTYQLGMGNIAMEYNKLLAEEIQNECKSRGMDLEAFMQQAIPAITNDMSIFFEIDGYVGLKNFESVKEQKIELSKVCEYSKRTIEYTNMILENQISPQAIMIFPSLMNQFLYMEFKFDNYQVMAEIIRALKDENKEDKKEFFNQVLKEIWYVERGRGLIFMIFRQQMEMMDKLMNGGMDPSMMGGMDPSMMGGMDPSMMGGMDPSMMGGMDPNMMGGMDPNMMAGMMGGMDPGMMGGMMGGMDPGMMGGMPPMDFSQMPSMELLQQAMQDMDLSKLEQMMPQMKEMMEMMNNQKK